MSLIPRLSQLCAEEVAINSKDSKTKERVREYLKRIYLPNFDLTCQHKMFHGVCDFMEYFQCNLDIKRIIRTVPKCVNAEYKLTVGEEEIIYVTTLSDLGQDMIKLDFPKGDYVIHPFSYGYVMKTKEYDVKIEDTYHIFNIYDSAKGLASVYWRAKTIDVHQLRIFNEYFGEYEYDVDWWENYSGFKFRTELEYLESCNNVPVLFYLTQHIKLDDLCDIVLSGPNLINNTDTNVLVCWNVKHVKHGRIGIAIKQTHFYKMMGDKVGICLLKSLGHRAIGNFENYTHIEEEDWQFCPDDPYECDFKKCSCDASYRPRIRKRKLSEPGCVPIKHIRIPIYMSDSN